MEVKIRGSNQGLGPIPASKNEVLGLIPESKNHVVGPIPQISCVVIPDLNWDFSFTHGFFWGRIILFSRGNSRQIDPVPCGAIDEFHHGEIATIQSPNYPRWKTV